MKTTHRTALMLALGLTAAATAAPAGANPPAEAFAALPMMRDPALSPDGEHFAAIQDMDGRPVVGVYDLESGGPAIAIPSDEWLIWGFQWVSNDRLAMMAGKGTRMPEGHGLWTLNRSVVIGADGSNPVPLLDNIAGLANNSSSASIVDLSIDDPDRIYMPLYAETQDGDFALDLFEVDVANGHGTQLARGSKNTRDWIMDGHGGLVARIDETRTPLTHHLMVPAGGSWHEIAAGDVLAEGGVGLAGLSEDGTALIRVGQTGGRYALTRLDIATGKETVLYAHPSLDVTFPIRDEWTGRVIGAGLESGGSMAVYFDPARQKQYAALQRAFPGLMVAELSSDRKRQRVIVATEGPRQPITYYYLDWATKNATEITSAYPGLTEADLGEMKPYDYKARDGVAIPAFVTLPPGKTPKNLPAVIMPHGGPDAHDTLGFDWWAQFLANRGYVVLQPNYRGSTGYGRAFNEAGRQQWGLKMQDDITDGVMKLIADGIVDPKRICIVGASYGGYAALAGAAFTPDLYACAVSVAGVSDLPDMIKYERSMHGRDSGAADFWISRIGSPSDDSDRLRATSPARHAANVKCPVLLIHGELDTTVPIAQSETMQEALEDAGKPVSLVTLAGDDHYLQLGSTRLQMLTELEKFLDANIGR